MKTPLRTGIVALIAVAFSTADSWAAKVTGARLTIADNKVSVAGQPTVVGTTIATGDTIVTGRRSHAELTLPDGTVVRIGQGSSLTYTGSKLVLNQGTALVRVAHKNTTVVSGSRTYTGGPAVVSAEASKKNDGLYILQGGGKVNGATLIPGQTSVLDHGKDRTFTFDLQKMEGSSALVTKFPQTPWVVQTEALAAVQHQLLTAKVTPASHSRSQFASQDTVSGSLANQVSTGTAGTSLAGRTGSPGSPVGGSLQLLGGPLSLGTDRVAVIKSAAISSATNGGKLQVSGASLTLSGVILTSASLRTVDLSNLTVNAPTQGSLTKMGAGVLALNGGTSFTGSAGSTSTVTINANFVLNTNVSGGILSAGNIGTLGNANGAGLIATSGTLNATGANTYRGATTVNAGTLTVNTTGVATNAIGTSTFNGGLTQTGAGTLTLTGANTFTGATTVNAGNVISQSAGATGGTLVLNGASRLGGLVQSGTILNVNGFQTAIVAGQTLTIGGVNYIATPVTGGGASLGTLNLQPVTH